MRLGKADQMKLMYLSNLIGGYFQHLKMLTRIFSMGELIYSIPNKKLIYGHIYFNSEKCNKKEC